MVIWTMSLLKKCHCEVLLNGWVWSMGGCGLSTHLWLLPICPLLSQQFYSDPRVLGADEIGSIAEVLKAHGHTEVCHDMCGETSDCQEPVTKTATVLTG